MDVGLNWKFLQNEGVTFDLSNQTYDSSVLTKDFKVHQIVLLKNLIETSGINVIFEIFPLKKNENTSRVIVDITRFPLNSMEERSSFANSLKSAGYHRSVREYVMKQYSLSLKADALSLLTNDGRRIFNVRIKALLKSATNTLILRGLKTLFEQNMSENIYNLYLDFRSDEQQIISRLNNYFGASIKKGVFRSLAEKAKSNLRVCMSRNNINKEESFVCVCTSDLPQILGNAVDEVTFMEGGLRTQDTINEGRVTSISGVKVKAVDRIRSIQMEDEYSGIFLTPKVQKGIYSFIESERFSGTKQPREIKIFDMDKDKYVTIKLSSIIKDHYMDIYSAIDEIGFKDKIIDKYKKALKSDLLNRLKETDAKNLITDIKLLSKYRHDKIESDGKKFENGVDGMHVIKDICWSFDHNRTITCSISSDEELKQTCAKVGSVLGKILDLFVWLEKRNVFNNLFKKIVEDNDDNGYNYFIDTEIDAIGKDKLKIIMEDKHLLEFMAENSFSVPFSVLLLRSEGIFDTQSVSFTTDDGSVGESFMGFENLIDGTDISSKEKMVNYTVGMCNVVFQPVMIHNWRNVIVKYRKGFSTSRNDMYVLAVEFGECESLDRHFSLARGRLKKIFENYCKLSPGTKDDIFSTYEHYEKKYDWVEQYKNVEDDLISFIEGTAVLNHVISRETFVHGDKLVKGDSVLGDCYPGCKKIFDMSYCEQLDSKRFFKNYPKINNAVN